METVRNVRYDVLNTGDVVALFDIHEHLNGLADLKLSRKTFGGMRIGHNIQSPRLTDYRLDTHGSIHVEVEHWSSSVPMLSCVRHRVLRNQTSRSRDIQRR